jgi:hypothetical protein
MRITPFHVLEQHAREEYRKRYAEVPEPKVINAHAWATFGAPRSLVWGGVGYWAPPLSYEDGMQCLIAANALRDIRRAGKPSPSVTQQAIAIARSHLRRQRPPFWRVRERVLQWAAHTLAVKRASPIETENALHWLIDVEDDAVYAPSERGVTVDLIANRYAFELAYKRKPESWKDYVYGLRHLGRDGAQVDFRTAVSTRVGVNADEKNWKQYERDQRAAAGWSNG